MPHFEIEVTTRFLVEAKDPQSARDMAAGKTGMAISEGYADVSVSVTERRSRDDVNYRLADLPVLSLTGGE